MFLKDVCCIEKLQQQSHLLSEGKHAENKFAQNKIELLQSESKKMTSGRQDYLSLRPSVTQLEKRRVKYTKSELAIKRQLDVDKNHVDDLQREIQGFTKRLATGADEYKTRFRKYTILQSAMKINHRQQNEEEQEENKVITTGTSTIDDDSEMSDCPMCYGEFPIHLTLDQKKEHLGLHFE